jgi:sugar phosphate isomerase/epimerase
MASLAQAIRGSAAPAPKMALCLHQTTSAAAGYRKSLEGYSKAGIKYVEVIAPHVDEFVQAEGLSAAKRLISDLGMKAVSAGGPRGLWDPGPARLKLIDELRKRCEVTAAIGADRIVCPSGASQKYTLDDYKRGIDHLREGGDIAKQFGVVLMVEFMRGSTYIGTLPTALKMTREAAHPNIKPMFDCYHFYAGLSKMEDIDMIREGEIHHVHFQDVPDIPRELFDNTTREIPGTGVSPLPRILSKLAERGYRGPISVELFHPEIQKTDPYEIALRIREKAEPVMKAAGVI